MILHEAGWELSQVLVAFEHSPDLMIAVDLEARIAAVNPAAARRAEVGAGALELFPQAARDEARESLARVLRSGGHATFEWGELDAAGVRSWYSAVVSPIVRDARVAAAIITSRDVTALKRSEQRGRRSEQLMVDTQGVAHLGTWEWDIAEPTATWSAELYRIYGLTPETYTPKYEAYLTMVHDDDRQRVIDATNRVFHEHVPYSHDERIFRPDGTMRYLHTWAHPVLDQTGALVKLVGVCQDITDLKQAEEALKRLNSELEQRVSERTKQLEAALHDLEAFNAMVSHDLRAPLAVIQMAVHVIENERELPARCGSLLERIQRSVENMARLVTDLLTFAQIGQGALQPVEVDVSSMCEELVSELRMASPDRDVDVTVEPGMRLHVDPTLFRAALGNLVGNAWKYTAHAHAARIQVGIVQRPDGRALYIHDNGIGFDSSDQERLFAPFARLPNATEFKGSGLGLATVQRIIERHGGRVRAEGVPGQGATFLVYVPPATAS